MKKLLFLILCTLVLCSSCIKDTGTPSESDIFLTETAAESNVLTNVFRGTEVELPADFEYFSGVTSCYDAENGTVTVFGLDGEDAALVSFGTDGKTVGERFLDMEGVSFTQTGAITSGAVYLLCYTEDMFMEEEYYILRYNLADATYTGSENLSGLFSNVYDFYEVRIAVDSEGYVYIESDSEIVVLNSELQYSFSVTDDWWIKDMPAAAGAVYVQHSSEIQKIDRESRMLAYTDEFPEGMDIRQYCFGDGYDLYYTTNVGLYGYNFASDEQPEGKAVLLCDWQNSNLFADNVWITNIISPDCMVMYNDDWTSLEIYQWSEDIDLSEIRILEIAYESADSMLSNYIVRFNKENPDIRIVTRDYSVYDTDIDRSAGEKKLINDILTGVYSPDIIYGHVHSDVFRQMLLENNLYTDLYTLMENDPDIKKDDLLGSIRRMCESEDGALMMLPGTFSVSSTLIAPVSIVGNRTGWTLSEMLDFIESLPEDVMLLKDLTQANAPSALFGNLGYRMFIDFESGTCNFEGEEFLRYLQILQTLPKGDDTYLALTGRSPELRDAYLNGGVALKLHGFYESNVSAWMSMYTAFGTKEVIPVGYASVDNFVSNAEIGFLPYIISPTCEHPEEAWKFVKTIILSYNPASLSLDGYPILKSQFEQMMQMDRGAYYEIYLDGTFYYRNDDRYDPNGELRKPGFRMLFDETEAAKMLDWFDNKIGLPFTKSVPVEVADIINEEISAYLSGIRTAEDCARVIQSRVSIWLAEHE